MLALAWFAACGDSPPPVIQPLGPVPSGTAGLGAAMVTAGQAAAGSGTAAVAGAAASTAGASAAGAAAGGAATAGSSAIAGGPATAGSTAVAGTPVAAAGSTASAGNTAVAGAAATAGVGGLAGTSGSAGAAGGAAGGTGTFTQVVKIFNDHYCGTCHAMAASDSANGSLMFNSATADKATLYNTFVGATSKSAQCSGKTYVTKGSPEQSLLYDKLANATPACGMRMPIGGQLTADEIAIVRSWIMAGAAND